jgi:hypothetical protein
MGAIHAMKESDLTFDDVMDKLRNSGGPFLMSQTMSYGVEQQCLKPGDFFHVDNLIVRWASTATFGETVQGGYMYRFLTNN